MDPQTWTSPDIGLTIPAMVLRSVGFSLTVGPGNGNLSPGKICRRGEAGIGDFLGRGFWVIMGVVRRA